MYVQWFSLAAFVCDSHEIGSMSQIRKAGRLLLFSVKGKDTYQTNAPFAATYPKALLLASAGHISVARDSSA